MALRVLLADESSTIKKVFQLSLQDFAVDVATVTVGLDVVNVARHFKPDIIFCDILLQKKNGYEVCSELKGDNALGKIPVVLMWSSFMELDEDKLEAARADARLEKPFDVKDLRKIVNQLVPKTQGNRLSAYLTFPKMPEMLEKPAATGPAPSGGGLETHKEWTMESFDPIPKVDAAEDFEEVALPPAPKPEADLLQEDEEDTQWSTKDLSSVKVSEEEIKSDELALKIPDDEILELEPSEDQEESPIHSKPEASVHASAPPDFPLTEEQLEAIIRKQSQTIIESVVWKIVPDLAQQVIERELKRLLNETR